MLRRQINFIFVTACIGVGSGLAAVGFQYCSSYLFLYGIQNASTLPFWQFVLIALLLTTGGALIAGVLMAKYAPEAAGSGIPHVKEVYQHQQCDFTWNLLWVKFISGILSIGTGSSLGREGPTIHMGAALGSKLAQSAKEVDSAKDNAICAGAAAGLAAAFNAPLSGVILVLEEISEGKNMDQYSGRCLLASAIAVSMIYLLAGNLPSLPIQDHIPMRWEVFWISPLVAVFAGFVGIFFQWATLNLRAFFKHSFIPLFLRPAVGAFLSVGFCLLAFAMTNHTGVFGLGEIDLGAALENRVIWQAAIWLLLAKVLATILCYGSGGCGGIFAPLIFIGGMSGLVIYGLSKEVLDLSVQDQTLLSLIGMTACLGSVVRAPLTSIVIVLEMTLQVDVLPALMVASVTAVFLNNLFFNNNFYGASIAQDSGR